MTAIRKTLPRLSSSSTSTSSLDAAASIPPNRLTSAFNKMKEECPDAIRLYATCVTNHHKLGSLEKDCCADEFKAVKDCFRSIRKG